LEHAEGYQAASHNFFVTVPANVEPVSGTTSVGPAIVPSPAIAVNVPIAKAVAKPNPTV